MKPPPSLSFTQFSHPQHHHAAAARTPHRHGQEHGPSPISAAGCGRRPFESIAEDLLGAAVLLDAGAGEMVRWVGGVNFLMDELGAATVLSLEEAEGLEKALKPYSRAVVLMTTYLWEHEHVLRALLGFRQKREWEEIRIYTSISAGAHTQHPLGETISRNYHTPEIYG
ncbi:hypothetical protein VYU27_010206, partial [Nannochloropsis oceanica]